jgi:hypothetical protein
VKDGQSVEKVKLSVNGIHITSYRFTGKIAYEDLEQGQFTWLKLISKLVSKKSNF